jgi:hypothetical protein
MPAAVVCCDMQRNRRESVLAELRARVAVLRERSVAELRALPPHQEEELFIDGSPTRMTTIIEEQPDGTLIVLIRSDTRRWGGLIVSGSTEGFVILPDGRRRDATTKEVQDFFA